MTLQTSSSLSSFPDGHEMQARSTCKILDSTISSDAGSVASKRQCVTALTILCIDSFASFSSVPTSMFSVSST